MGDLVSKQEPELKVVQVSPIQAIQQLTAAGIGVEDLKQMLALQKEYEAHEARKAFYSAMSEFKRNPPIVIKDMMNAQYGSDYVSIGNMVNTVNEELGKHGLTARWTFTDTDSGISCKCILAHKLGHEEFVVISGPIDQSGKKNPLQGRKSTRTYLKLETFEAITGMASVSGNVDDDGNSAGFSPKENLEPVRLPEIPQSEFEAKTEKMKEAVQAGRKTPEAIISTLSTKYTLTPFQIETVNTFKETDNAQNT